MWQTPMNLINHHEICVTFVKMHDSVCFNPRTLSWRSTSSQQHVKSQQVMMWWFLIKKRSKCDLDLQHDLPGWLLMIPSTRHTWSVGPTRVMMITISGNHHECSELCRKYCQSVMRGQSSKTWIRIFMNP